VKSRKPVQGRRTPTGGPGTESGRAQREARTASLGAAAAASGRRTTPKGGPGTSSERAQREARNVSVTAANVAALAATSKDRAPVRRTTPKGGPGTGTERVQRGLPADYGKNIIPQGSFWVDGRKTADRKPFRNKWGFIANGLRRACGDKSMAAGNWLGAAPAPPPPSNHVPKMGLRKTPSAKDSRSMWMSWYSYYALYPLLARNLKEQDVSDGSRVIESGEMVYDSTGVPLLYHAGADILDREALPGTKEHSRRVAAAAAKALPAGKEAAAAALPEGDDAAAEAPPKKAIASK